MYISMFLVSSQPSLYISLLMLIAEFPLECCLVKTTETVDL